SEPETSATDEGEAAPQVDADFDFDNDDLVFAEPEEPQEAEGFAPVPSEPEGPVDPDVPPVSADIGETVQPEPDRDEVADFYGDQASEPALEKPQEPIVIGRSRRRLTIPAGLAAGWAGLVLAVLAIGFLTINQREAIVRAMPGSAWAYASLGMPVNVRGLDFRDVAYSWESDAGRIVLEVHGDIVNITDRDMQVPPVVFALRDEVKKEVYQWEEAVLSEPLGAGASAAFAIRIPTPPKSIKSVQVRFARAR
ncbi:MAG: hypothetical protein MI861_19825, partial [Pirellulales bacterium]|nr:hypothetical protein [Pirellulales bacterium]